MKQIIAILLVLVAALAISAEPVFVRIYDGGVEEYPYSYRGDDGKLVQGKRWVWTIWYDTIGSPDRSFVLVNVKEPSKCPPNRGKGDPGYRKEYASAVRDALPKIAHDLQCEVGAVAVEYVQEDGSVAWGKIEDMSIGEVPKCLK